MNLKLLRHVVNTLCAPPQWAEAHCVQTEKYVNDIGDIGYRVYIGEASPELQKYMAEELKEKYFQDIEVIIITP